MAPSSQELEPPANPGRFSILWASIARPRRASAQLRDWVKKFGDDSHYAFPGHGQMEPEQLEIAQLKREVIKLKAERDILKKAQWVQAVDATVCASLAAGVTKPRVGEC